MITDNNLYSALITAIQNAEPAFGIPNVLGKPGVPVYQSYQPTAQGVPTGPCAFLEILGHQRIGQPLRLDYYDSIQSQEFHEESQVMLTQFQLSALATQDPTSTTQYTAADIVNIMAMILQNSQTLDALIAQGYGLQLASATRNPKFLDDRDRFEASPSFDFNITYNLTISRTQNVVQSTSLAIYPV